MSEKEPGRVDVSVIIPTYNRKDSLLRALDSLSRQTYPAECFEVIVVDDGSNDDTAGNFVQRSYPFHLNYLRQVNQGATAARNHGAAHSQGEHLVFMDDDIVPGAATIRILIDELVLRQRTVVLGSLSLPSQLSATSPYARAVDQGRPDQRAEGFVPFQECLTGLLAINKTDFFNLGMFQDPTGGWPNWDDIDFGYRASVAGFRFWRSASAVAEHWDYAAHDLGTACQRLYRASKSAPRLFQRYPALKARIPMFRDKAPIEWRQDTLGLIIRKLIRQIMSARLTMAIMRHAVPYLENRSPQSELLALLYRWVCSGHIYRGYRDGLGSMITGSIPT